MENIVLKILVALFSSVFLWMLRGFVSDVSKKFSALHIVRSGSEMKVELLLKASVIPNDEEKDS